MLKKLKFERSFFGVALAIMILLPVQNLVVEARPIAARTSEFATRASPGMQTYWVEQLACGLRFPSSLAWLPSGEMLIAERTGGLRVLRGDNLGEPIKGLPTIFHNSLGDGLKDILIDPDYISNQRIYLLISEGTFEKRYAAVYRARFADSELMELELIFRSKDGDSVLDSGDTLGSRMMFRADKTLLIGVGEDFKNRAQQLDSHNGKILRINRDGGVPADNPFVKTPGALPEIWSFGHRIVLGMYQDPKTGETWEVESGPRGGDELNLLKPGGNFGWSKVSWGFRYSNTGSYADQQSAPGIEDPILIWTPSVTPSGLARYQGRKYPLWDGDLFVGLLTARELARLRFDGTRLQLQERMLSDLEERIRDVKVGPDNYLYLLTDHENGRVLRLRPGHPSANQFSRVAQKLEKSWDLGQTAKLVTLELGDPARGREEFRARCAACHSVGNVIDGGHVGPDLANVYGRRAGRESGFAYSKSMAARETEWDLRSLYGFLADPDGVVPGTTMSVVPVSDTKVRLQIIGFLKEQSSN